MPKPWIARATVWERFVGEAFDRKHELVHPTQRMAGPGGLFWPAIVGTYDRICAS